MKHIRHHHHVCELAHAACEADAARARVVINALRREIDRLARGTAIVTVETDRIELASPEKLLAVAGDDDPELEAKAANNHPLANERSLLEVETPVIDGRFEIVLDDPLPPRAAVVKAYAWGADTGGRPIDAIGSLRLIRE